MWGRASADSNFLGDRFVWKFMSIVCFWFRRDLRLQDNAGLFHALQSGHPVLPVFIFDEEILDKLPNKEDRRVEFIYESLVQLDTQLREQGSGLLVMKGSPEAVWKKIIQKYSPTAVYTNRDYEPYARQRDGEIKALLESKGVIFQTFKDQVIFEEGEVTKDDGKPYTVFTPYKRKWLSLLTEGHYKAYASDKIGTGQWYQGEIPSLMAYEGTGFRKSLEQSFPDRKIPVKIIERYDQTRDFPAIAGTSRLSVHLRFGTLSIRKAVEVGIRSNATWLSELIWREFYMMILWHFPHVVKGAFKPAYDAIPWENNPEWFKAWCEGKTGFPIVDAGMRELSATGFMHNRVRMITASFLTKHLLIDWRWGEAWFAEKLLDFDLSANNGGWQWAAGSGCDAAPYFRVFSPDAQTERFDGKADYIRKWVPEYGTSEYPKPIVNHAVARVKAVEVYRNALKND